MKIKIDSHLLDKAIIFAAKAHETQTRKGDGRPYILHPMSVMFRILSFKGFKQSTNPYLLAIAAILHDVVEDCEISIQTIAVEFGYSVAALVEELTLDKSKYGESDYDKSEYLAQEVFDMSSYALAIKLCDRWDNICDTHSMPPEFKRKYVPETLRILKKLEERKLSSTHKKLIKEIYKELKKIK